jgi:hypothetical protein
MVVAKAYPNADGKGGRGKKCSGPEQFPMIARSKLSEARAVPTCPISAVGFALGAAALAAVQPANRPTAHGGRSAG